jgi:hypothetical protein
MVKRWEDRQKVAIIMTRQDPQMAKVICESHWNVRHESDANRSEKVLDRYYHEVPKEEGRTLYGFGGRSRDSVNHVLRQPITHDKKIEMWENTLNHHCGDQSKCHYQAHQGYQWKNRNIPEAQASLRQHLAEGSRTIQKS